MAQDVSAHDTQAHDIYARQKLQRGRNSTGFRRLTPGLLQAERTAEGFSGLPKKVDTPFQLLAAFKAAAPYLGIGSRLVHAIDWLFSFTRPQDWEKNSRPIVWPSARLQQEALCLSRTQVKTLNRQLADKGLLTMKDSPNGKRYGMRDPRDRIVEAYGFDLSPLAVRYAEFIGLAEARKAERRVMARLRRQATVARKTIEQIIAAAAENGFGGEEWQTLATDTQKLVRVLKRIGRPKEMEVGVAGLERIKTAARERLETLLKTADTGPKELKKRPHIYNYIEKSYPVNQDTVTTSEECRCTAAQPASQPEEPVQRSEPITPAGIRPDELPQLAPKLIAYLRRPRATWPDIVEAAYYLCYPLGVSQSLWGEACATMGREQAAIALAIVSSKPPEHFRTTPGGYFHGMVAKAKAGELYLNRTIWAWRRALAQEDQQNRERRSRRL